MNVGSSDAFFREHVQPWISDEILLPLQKRGARIANLDFRTGEGIDLHGDLTDEAFMSGLREHGFRSLLCCNLLEHVTDREGICKGLEQLVPKGGCLVITVPHAFPYHPDPIDTLFRPGVAEIVSLFPNCNLIKGEIVSCGTGWDYVGGSLSSLVQKVRQRVEGMRDNGGIRGSSSFLPWLFKNFLQTCVIMERQS